MNYFIVKWLHSLGYWMIPKRNAKRRARNAIRSYHIRAGKKSPWDLKIKCECGAFVRRSGLACHRRRTRHTNLMTQQDRWAHESGNPCVLKFES